MGNAEIVRTFYEAYNRRDWDAVARLLAPSVEWFHAARDELVHGPDAVIALFKSSAEAFPEARVEVRAIHEAGDFVITECTFTRAASGAARNGGLNGSANGHGDGGVGPRPMFCEIEQFKEGKCVRGITYADMLRLLTELGQAA